MNWIGKQFLGYVPITRGLRYWRNIILKKNNNYKAKRPYSLQNTKPFFRAAVVAGHTAFAMVALSYLVRDIFQLRCLSVGASLLSITYSYYIPPKPLWLVINWNFIFIFVNVVHMAILVVEQQPVVLLPEEGYIYLKVFHNNISKRDFRKLMNVGKFRDIPAGCEIVTQGLPAGAVTLLVDGTVTVYRDEVPLCQVGRHHFIGDLSYLNPIHKDMCPVTTKAEGPGRCVTWLQTDLEKLSTVDLNVHNGFMSVLAENLAEDVDYFWIRESRLSQYRMLFQGAVLRGDLGETERMKLAEYRSQLNLTYEEHLRIIEEVGWDESSYRIGIKQASK